MINWLTKLLAIQKFFMTVTTDPHTHCYVLFPENHTTNTSFSNSISFEDGQSGYAVIV